MDWNRLKGWLKGKYDSPLRVESLRNELRNLMFKGNLARYSENFRMYESQIPAQEMTFGDCLSHFLSHLPADSARDLRREKPKNTKEMYYNARELDRLSNLHRGSQNHSSVSSNKKPKHLFHRGPPRSSAFSNGSAMPSISPTPVMPSALSNSGPVPMELDAMQQMPRGSNMPNTRVTLLQL
ncbi:hypothetical protein SCP_0509220 [Sparassis crispa]|uniref:Retrotransposon gag domain-containing protein n=1 Tax=Sparassis crispa TaxID=139825 RepID=A0A401GNR6_9APHY|nr:hypothetical protein SCP_0509220 [Sparassis crispa]GBE83865.1 hypothetical protein SCP_0509220 [Sparassis crispa]